jgi:cytochrome c553
MATRKHPRVWAFWLASSLIAAVGLVYALANGDDKRLFMPGPLSHGHHQIDLACGACHADPFGEAAVMENACVGCHGDQRKKPLDSHPKTKFKDPRKIVNRLAGKDKVITASEHFDDEQALVLPAQMFRFGAEMVAERAEENPDVNFSYSLQSIWPVNKQNAPRTDAEKEGLQYVADNKGENFYAVEELGGTKYFTAVYADTAVAPVCVSCHNDHKDSPRRDFKMGDVMGGVIIRIPIEG